MFDLLHDLFARSDDDDDDDDGEELELVDDRFAEEEEESGDDEVVAPAAAAATDIVAAVAASDELATNDASEIILKSVGGDSHTDDNNKNEDANIRQEHGGSVGRDNEEDNNNILHLDENDIDDGDNDNDRDEEVEWNEMFQEFKTGILSLKSSVSAVSAVAADVLTGAIEEAHASMTTSLIMSAGVARPPFVLTAADEDEDEYFENSGDEMMMMKFVATSEGVDGDSEENIDDEDEEVHFLEAPTNTDPRRLNTPLKLESLDVVKMRQRLMRAEEQRNLLMQMVDGRNEEICKLRFHLDQRKQQRSCRQAADSNSDAIDHQKCGDSSKRYSGGERIQFLKREVEWRRHLVSSINDTDQHDASIKALSAILQQLRDDVHQSRNCSVRESIKASEEVIRDLQFRIQKIKDNT